MMTFDEIKRLPKRGRRIQRDPLTLSQRVEARRPKGKGERVGQVVGRRIDRAGKKLGRFFRRVKGVL